jgi:hypothetical protein
VLKPNHSINTIFFRNSFASQDVNRWPLVLSRIRDRHKLKEYGNFMSKNMFDDLASTSPNRERFMMTLNTATELMGGGGSPSEAISETDILNFALNLEYLEAEFYTYAVEGKSITSFGIGVDGKANG